MATAEALELPSPLLQVSGLWVNARDRKGHLTTIVEDISFAVEPGKVLALIGESGSGKTTVSLACMGYARAGCEITQGRVRLAEQQVLDLDVAARRVLRGRDIAYIAQSAAASFNGALSLNAQVTETPVIRELLSPAQAEKKAHELYRELDLANPESIGKRYPHQVSGGQLQRVMAAMAMICDPKLLILDEPTTALDVTTQIEVLRAFKKLIRSKRTSAIYVSHDLAVVAQVADRVLVLKEGKVVEQGAIEQIIQQPQHDYTRALIGAAHVMPKIWPASPSSKQDRSDPPLLSVTRVTAGYGRSHQHLALREVSLDAYAARTTGIIGESGSGKTTLGRVVTGLMPVKSGRVELAGQLLDDRIDRRDREQLRNVQFAFQMADVALNPRHKIKKILGRPLSFYFDMAKSKAADRVIELLELVELPAHYAERYPRQLSGGERQRVNLARALAAEPKLVICDEITSALDTVVAKSILKLLKDLQDQLQVGYLFISHDISVVAEIADSIVVMRAGEVVETGATNDVLTPPHHRYTELLLQSVPELRTDWLDQLG